MEVERDRRGEARIGIAAVKSVALTLGRDLNEIVGISAWTRSGLGVSAQFDGLFVMDQILRMLEFIEGIVQGVPVGGQAPAAAYGGRRQRQI